MYYTRQRCCQYFQASPSGSPLPWAGRRSSIASRRSGGQAVACVGLLKSSGDQAAIDGAKSIYAAARAEMDGVVDGLVIALVDGGKPESLATVRASLEWSGQSLKAICDAATKTIAPNTKGVWEEIAKGAIDPVVKAVSDGVGGLWAQHVEKDKLALETRKTKLEAAKWPEFGDIAAQ